MRDTAALTLPRSVAFYLPQYHPIPENDWWWGAGYTEWYRVVAARPQFRGHEQPHLPGELGFYDLRLPEAREMQAELARTHSIDAFCYYHYWFSGRRLLERPFNQVLGSGTPDLPFMLCWANEPWTRAWDGLSGEVLIDHATHASEAERFALELVPAFADDRYVRYRGRPVLLVYRANRLADPVHVTDTWRRVVTDAGLPDPYLCRVESSPDERGDPAALGFDVAVEFQPDWAGIEPSRSIAGVAKTLQRRSRSIGTLRRRHRVIPYDSVVEYALERPDPPYVRWPGVTPGWDNTARRARHATILRGATPEKYGCWVEHAVDRLLTRGDGDGFLFVNAWNEWSEGCHLEPSVRWGRAFLEAHRDALERARSLR